MKLKVITVISLIANVIAIGGLLYLRTSAPKEEFAEDTTVDFDSAFYDRINTQNLEIQNLLLLSDSSNFSSENKNIMAMISPFSEELRRKSRNCVALKDKRKFSIELGQLSIKVKNGQPVDIQGLKISREEADNLLAQIFVYDRAIVNICLQLEKVNPDSPEDRKFILDLLDRQQAIVSSYEKFKLQISQANSEEDVMKAVKSNKPSVDSLNKTDSLKNGDSIKKIDTAKKVDSSKKPTGK